MFLTLIGLEAFFSLGEEKFYIDKKLRECYESGKQNICFAIQKHNLSYWGGIDYE